VSFTACTLKIIDSRCVKSEMLMAYAEHIKNEIKHNIVYPESKI